MSLRTCYVLGVVMTGHACQTARRHVELEFDFNPLSASSALYQSHHLFWEDWVLASQKRRGTSAFQISITAQFIEGLSEISLVNSSF